MNKNISIKGMVENISVNGIDHKQHKHNMIVDQGLNTLVSISSKCSTKFARYYRPLSFLQNDFRCNASTSDVWYSAFPAVGCLFGTGDTATVASQTALESPIGSVDDLDSFGFNRNDYGYSSSFVVYERNSEREVHHLKYVWKATETTTVKEVGIYSFLMPDDVIAAGFTSSQIMSLSNYTNRKLFSRCVLNTPVDVTKGDMVVVYYDVTLALDHPCGSIISTDNVFGLPAVTMISPLTSNISMTVSQTDFPMQTFNSEYVSKVNSNDEPGYMYNINRLSILSHLNPLVYGSNTSSYTAYSMTNPYLIVNTTSTPYFTLASVAYAYQSYRSATGIEKYTPLGINLYNGTVFTETSMSLTSTSNSNSFHTVSKVFNNTSYINGTKKMMLVYDNYQFILNATADENGTITQSALTLPQNCTLTFDVVTTLNRGENE